MLIGKLAVWEENNIAEKLEWLKNNITASENEIKYNWKATYEARKNLNNLNIVDYFSLFPCLKLGYGKDLVIYLKFINLSPSYRKI